MKRHIFALVVAVLFVVLPAKDIIRASTSSYTVEDLGAIDGLVPTVTGMNASGQVSGYVNTSTGARAVRFTGTQWEYVPGVAAYSLALAINENGDVAGYHIVTEGYRAFRYTSATRVTTTIAPPLGGSFAIGYAINASGVVVGYGDSLEGIRGWRAGPGDSATVVLPTLGGAFSMACGVNDNGQVVGSATTATGHQHAYRVNSDNATVTEIVPFDGATGSGHACAIDAAGRVGGFTTSSNVNRAFVFDNGALLNLDTFAGSTESNVAAIANGVSVGWFVVSNAAKAFVHTDENRSENLNDLIPPGSGWLLDQAFAVNTAGHIAGNGRLNGQPRAFLLKPAKDTTPPVISAVSATPSTVWPPNDQMVDVAVAVTATDDVDATPVCALSSITASGTTTDDYSFTGLAARVRAVGGRTYTLNVTCTDAAGNASPASSTTVVVPPDTTAPVISSVHATPGALWPPNGKMVSVTVTVSASDDVDSAPQCSLTSVTSTGGAAADAVVTGQFTADVRAEKNHDGTVRVYNLNVTCADRAKNASAAAATVFVGKGAGEVTAFARGKSKR